MLTSKVGPRAESVNGGQVLDMSTQKKMYTFLYGRKVNEIKWIGLLGHFCEHNQAKLGGICQTYSFSHIWVVVTLISDVSDNPHSPLYRIYSYTRLYASTD